MRNAMGQRVPWRHRALRLLGVVSPSGAHPLPPRWAMSEEGRDYWRPEPAREGVPAPACGPGSASRASSGRDGCEGPC